MAKQYKALSLLSGGLDSQLAVRVLQEQGVEEHALTFLPPWYPETEERGKLSADELIIVNISGRGDKDLEEVRRLRGEKFSLQA